MDDPPRTWSLRLLLAGLALLLAWGEGRAPAERAPGDSPEVHAVAGTRPPRAPGRIHPTIPTADLLPERVAEPFVLAPAGDAASLSAAWAALRTADFPPSRLARPPPPR